MTPQYALGLFYIFCVSVIWSLASILVQYMYHDLNFDSPFVVTYVGSSLFAVLLLINVIMSACAYIVQRRKRSQHTPISMETTSFLSSNYASHGTHLRIACKIAPFWFLANYLYNASLKDTSITSSTVLSSTGSLFTYAFAILTREESCEIFKLVGVIFAIAGSIITGLKDASSSDESHVDTLYGDFSSLLSAVGYGVYTVMIRKYCKTPVNDPVPDSKNISIQLVLGYVGLVNMLSLMPIFIYYVIDRNSTPTVPSANDDINDQNSSYQHLTWFILGCLVVKGLSDNVLSDYLWARSIVLTSATVASVGVGLTIPLAMISDLWMSKDPGQVFSLPSIFGALFVLVGFVLVNLEVQKGANNTNHLYEEAPQNDESLKEISIHQLEVI